MWQTQYYLHLARMRELEAEADRRRRWQVEDASNGRWTVRHEEPNRVRAAVARAAALVSRAAARFAVRLDGRVVVDPGSERLLRDA